MIIGKSIQRVDAHDKATGRTKYADDLCDRGALIAKVLHASIGHGFVKSVDTSEAEKIPGVVKIVTCFDVPENYFPTAGHPWSTDPGHQDVKDRLLLTKHVRYYGDPDQMVVTCAILPGSGKGEIDLAVKANADVYVTGDISHHDGIDAVEKGIAVIDAGHYGIEKIFVPYMKEYLEREMPEIRIISCDQGAPFLET